MATTITDLNRTMRRIEAVLNLLLEGQGVQLVTRRTPTPSVDNEALRAIMASVADIDDNTDGIEGLLTDIETNTDPAGTAPTVTMGDWLQSINNLVNANFTELQAVNVDLAAMEVLDTTRNSELVDINTELDNIESTVNSLLTTLSIIEVLQTLYAASDNSRLGDIRTNTNRLAAIETATVDSELTLDTIDTVLDNILIEAREANFPIVEPDASNVNLIHREWSLTPATLGPKVVTLPAGPAVYQLESLELTNTDTVTRIVEVGLVELAGLANPVRLASVSLTAGSTRWFGDAVGALGQAQRDALRHVLSDNAFPLYTKVPALNAGKRIDAEAHFSRPRGPVA